PADEPGADEALVDEVGAEGQLTAGMELGDPGAGAGAARGTVEPAGVDGHGVPAVPGVGTGGDELDVVADGDTGVVGVDGPVLGVDRVHQGETGVEDPLLGAAVERQPDPLDRQDRVEVAPERQVVPDGAEPGDR